jgi:restriction system protein
VTPVQLPKYSDLLAPTLRALTDLGGSGSIEEIVSKVAELEGFTDEQQSAIHKDGPRTVIEYRLAWARSYLKAVSAVENSTRGVWSITAKGREMTPTEIAKIPGEVRAAYKRTPGGTRRRRPPVPDGGGGSGGQEEDEDAAWKEELLAVLLTVPPDRFEHLSRRLLREAGFINLTVTGRANDGGIDGVGVMRMGLLSFPIFFQCKRYRGSVPPKEVRDFRGAMAGRGDKGLLITTGTFTAEAKREAARDGAPPVDLIDGDQLCDLLKQYSLGVESHQVEQVTLKPEWFASV